MRQIIPGGCDSTKLRGYKGTLRKDSTNNMQSIDQRRSLLKPKRLRSAFTTDQINYLEKAYKRFPYIDRETRQHLASVLKLGERPIKIWFQNRRMKEKKDNLNHKEFDVEIRANDLQLGQHQLNNVHTLPSTNDNHSFSMPTLPPIADSTVHTNSLEVNKADYENKPSTYEVNRNLTVSTEQKKTPILANFYNEIKSTDGELNLSPYFNKEPKTDSYVPYVPEPKKKKPSPELNSTKSLEISINLCKKYKKERVSTEAPMTDNVVNESQIKKPDQDQLAPMKEPNNTSESKHSDVGQNIGVPGSIPPRPGPHMNMNKPIFLPLMPGMYPTPFLGSDGVLWKPVNFMPVMASNGSPITMGNQAPIQGIQNCTCNCHSNPHVPVAFPPVQNPYTQYVISVPFPHTSPNF